MPNSSSSGGDLIAPLDDDECIISPNPNKNTFSTKFKNLESMSESSLWDHNISYSNKSSISSTSTGFNHHYSEINFQNHNTSFQNLNTSN